MTAPAALQRHFPIADPLLRILVTLNGAREREAFKNYTTEDFLWLIDNGHLVAFNIALRTTLPSAGSTPDRVGPDRELRIFPDSLDYYAKTNGNPKARKNPYAATWDRLILHLDHKPFLLATRIQVILNCSHDHVTDLINAGLIKQVEGTAYRRGRTGVAVITRDSFLAFLKSRLEGA